MIQNQDFIQEFVEEAKSHVEKVEAALLKKEDMRNDKDLINSVFRAVHSVKGTAGFFGLTKIVSLAHSMENVFAEIRAGKRQLDDYVSDIMLEASDCLKDMVDDVLNSEETDVDELVKRLDMIFTASGNDKENLERELFSKAIDISENKIFETEIDGNSISSEPKPDEEKNDEYEANECNKEEHKVENSKNSNKSSRHLKVEDSIRVHVSVLNDLLNMASEMVLGRNQLLRTLDDYRKSIPGLSPILQNIDRLTSGMQEKIMQTRMQPMSNVFNKFPRIIRDLSKSLGKEIELQLEGEDVELDKSVIEALTDPLTHLIRNAADHGLESPAERERKGKTSVGCIKLKAFHEGGYVNIDIVDDGDGIDSEKIAAKAIEKGVCTKDEIAYMTEKELLKLVLRPGFSTAEKVSNISGRGVGMDVVMTNIAKLGGSIEIHTVKNAGTTIRLMLPLTLAIIQSLVVEVAGHRFALPQANLKEIVRIKQGDKTRRIEFLNDSQVLRLRNKLLPIIHLADILGIRKTDSGFINGEGDSKLESTCPQVLEQCKNDDSGNAECNTIDTGIIRILVLQMGTKYFGLAVDSIFASEETLVKPLPIYLKNCECYSGVTIMGDGKTAMILDIDGLIRISGLKFKEDGNVKESTGNVTAEKQNILLFKCSGNETYAIDLSMVSRVEEIKTDDIEKIGDKKYIKFRGDSMRVITLEDYLPVNRTDSTNTKKYVIIPKLVSYPIGIIAEKIIDNINIKLTLNTEDVKVKGLLGSAIYDNRIILLINLYEIFEKADPVHYQREFLQSDNSATVLIVEDTPFFQRLEKEYLVNAGYRVITASDGKEALNILQDSVVDVIVSDIQMPFMDGFELAKKIRSDKRLMNIPMIAVTSMTGEQPKAQALDSGFDYYEAKLDRNGLLNIVYKALGKPERSENGAKSVKL